MTEKKTLVMAGIAFLTLWPLVAIWIGIGPLWLFLDWFLSAGALGVGGNVLDGRRVSKVISAPAFGEFTTPNWKGVACYWNGKINVPGSTNAVAISVHCADSGPSSAQRTLLEKVLTELGHLKTTSINALRASDRTEWPEAAREGTLELILIQLEDEEDTREGIFSLRFESPADPEAEYYADFRNGAIEEAYRLD